MGQNTEISWCDHTFNPWEGCTKVSPGCQHCYAEARNKRFKGGNWGKGAPRRRTSASNWRQPKRWNYGPFVCGKCGKAFQQITGIQQLCEPIPGDPCQHCNFGSYRRPRVFCASLADWLDDEVPIEWLADLLKLIHDTPNLDWLLLTKRPENFLHRTRLAIAKGRGRDSIGPDEEEAFYTPDNVWIGTTVENQDMANQRIPALLRIPAKIRFLSVEPMLDPIELKFIGSAPYDKADSDGATGEVRAIDWVIVGGESGPKARPCNIEWIRSVKRQCEAAKVPAFVKQLGKFPLDVVGGRVERYVTVHPKGGDIDEFPPDLRVREFPNVANRV